MHFSWVAMTTWQEALADGKEGDVLVPLTQQLVGNVASYKNAAGSVKSLLPKAKAAGKAKGKAKAKAASWPEAEAWMTGAPEADFERSI